MAEQPSPLVNDQPAVWDAVIKDMQERDAGGVQKYKVHLQPFNGRDALQDAYEESLDQTVYLKQAIAERDNVAPDNAYEALLRKCLKLLANESVYDTRIVKLTQQLYDASTEALAWHHKVGEMEKEIKLLRNQIMNRL